MSFRFAEKTSYAVFKGADSDVFGQKFEKTPVRTIGDGSSRQPLPIIYAVFQRLGPPRTRLLTTLNWTHCECGKIYQIQLCLGLPHRRISNELRPLGKVGNSSTWDRKQLIKLALADLPVDRCCLLAHREFIGYE